MVSPVIAKLIESVIAAMITFAPPGYSMYSQVPVAYCDEACQQTPVCDDPSWRCKPPRLDPTLYQQKTQELLAQGHSIEQAMEYAKPLAFTRTETFEEGIVRYRVIAEAVVRSSLRTSQGVCKNQCKQLTDEAEVIACHHSCNVYAPWKWNYKELVYLTIVAWGNESGFRADVHGGVGVAGRGDCGYLKAGKQVAANTIGATRFCKSVCLGQANVGLGYVLVAGHRWHADDLVGVDLASTERCAMVSMATLSRSRAYCNGPMSASTNDWAGATLSMYGTGNKCDAPKLMARSKAFYGLMLHPTALPQNVLDMLADPQVTSTVSYLQNVSPVSWPLALDSSAATAEPKVAQAAEAVLESAQATPPVRSPVADSR
jgi:hypothetical protein